MDYKDILIIRTRADGTFEDYPIAVPANSVLISTPQRDIEFVDTSSFIAGTGSIEQAISSSHSETASYSVSSLTASHALNASQGNSQSASWASSSLSASYAITTSYYSYYNVTQSLTYVLSASFASSSLSSSTSTYSLTAQDSTSSVSSSYAISASYSQNASSGNSQSSSWASSSLSSSLSQYSISSSYVDPSGLNFASLQSSYFKIASKLVSLTTASFATGVTVTMGDFNSVHVDVSIHGNWNGPVGYYSTYFLQKGDGGDTSLQPGIIIEEINNNKNGQSIFSQITDVGAVSGNADIDIQFQLQGDSNLSNALLVYQVRGEFVAVT